MRCRRTSRCASRWATSPRTGRRDASCCRPLSEHAVCQLAEDSAVEPGELYRLTGGSPFFARVAPRLAFHADAAGDATRVLEHAPRAARAAAAVASHREAAAQLERAVRHAGDTELVTRAALHDELADELARVERWDDAATTQQAAIDFWREAGDTLRGGRRAAAARIVRRRMRDHGLRAIPVGIRDSTRSDPHGLTRREREVFELVRGNLTNEQIAEHLMISVKTG